MRIAIVVRELNVRGGTHKQVLRLCGYLKLKQEDVVIYTLDYQRELTYPDFAKFDIVDFKKKNPYKNGIIRKIHSLRSQIYLYHIVKEKYDVINFHGNGLILTMLLCLREAKKMIWQINDMPGCFLKGVASNRKDNLRSKAERILYSIIGKRVKSITVNVSKNKARVLECFERDDTNVFYCGVDINNLLHIHNKVNDKSNIRILSTGILFPYRNYETCINVVEKMNLEGIKTSLSIVGACDWDKEYANKISQMAKSSLYSDKITIYGQVDEKEYVKIYDESDIFMFLNIDQSWGLAVFEAMSCGLPTIVSNSVGATELLHDGKDSIIVNPTDCNQICEYIRRLVFDDGFYSNISSKGQEQAYCYTWDEMYSSKMRELFYNNVANE